MRDPIIGSMIEDVIRQNREILNVVKSVSLTDRLIETVALHSIPDLINAQQEVQARYLNSIAENSTQSMIAQATRQRAHEFMQPVYDQYQSSLPDAVAILASRNVLEDALANIGTAAIGIHSIVERMNELARTASDVSALVVRDDIGRFMGSLPDLTSTTGVLRLIQAEEGKERLEEHDYGFASILLPLQFLTGIALIAAPVRAATITRRLTDITRKDDFRKELELVMSRSAFLSRRWPIVERAIDAHRERNYYLSIPALLPQVEGAMADALILKGLVAVRGGKLYRKDPKTGKLKRDKRDNPIELKGGHQLLQGNPLADHPILHQVADVLSSQLVNDKMFDLRNLILHGRKINYNKASVSTRALLVLLTVAPEIADFEAGNIESRP